MLFGENLQVDTIWRRERVLPPDLAAEAHPRPRNRSSFVHRRKSARLSTEYVCADDVNGNWGQNAPRWTGRPGLNQGLAADRHLAAEALFAGRRLTPDNATLAAVVAANLALSTARGPGKPDISAGLYNVFNRFYTQPVDGGSVDRVVQPGRAWRVTVGYSF